MRPALGWGASQSYNSWIEISFPRSEKDKIRTPNLTIVELKYEYNSAASARARAPNLTIVELKFHELINEIVEIRTPNLTIVELKYASELALSFRQHSPNLTIVELKYQIYVETKGQLELPILQ